MTDIGRVRHLWVLSRSLPELECQGTTGGALPPPQDTKGEAARTQPDLGAVGNPRCLCGTYTRNHGTG